MNHVTYYKINYGVETKTKMNGRVSITSKMLFVAIVCLVLYLIAIGDFVDVAYDLSTPILRIIQ